VVAGDISVLDASLVLQHDAGVITLSPWQQVAGDGNGSGQPTAFDASLILQYAVDLIGLPFPGAGRVWAFSPPSRSYTPLNLNQTGQDFAGILVGDSTGNWGDGVGEGTTGSAVLAFAGVAAGGSGVARLQVESLSPATELYGIELRLSNDPVVMQVESVTVGTAAGGWSLVVNDRTPGELWVAMAGVTPLTGAGEILVIGYAASGPRATLLSSEWTYLNEGQVTSNAPAVQVNGCPLFSAGFETGDSSAWSHTVP
jgi:hypothetical protein